MDSNMDFYSDFHNCQLELMKKIKSVEDELFGLEKSCGDESELCNSLERELNFIERELSHEKVRSLKVSTCKDDLSRKISLMEDSIKEEKASLASTQDATAGKKYRVLQECQNVADMTHNMMGYFSKQDFSRKIFELEDILSTEENNLAKITAYSHNASMEIKKLKREIADASAHSNAVIVDFAGTILKLKSMKPRKTKPFFKESSVNISSFSNQYNKTNLTSFTSTLPQRNDNREGSVLDRMKAKYQAYQPSTAGSNFSSESFGRKPLFPKTQLPLQSSLLQGQKILLQRSEFKTPVPVTPIQNQTLPPKQLEPSFKQVHQSMITPDQSIPVKKIPPPILPRKQLQKPVNKMQKMMLPPTKLQPPPTHTASPMPFRKPLLKERNQTREVDFNQSPKNAPSSILMAKSFEFPGGPSPQSSCSSSNNDIFSSKPGEISTGFGSDFSFMTSGISEANDIDSLFGSSNTGFYF